MGLLFSFFSSAAVGCSATPMDSAHPEGAASTRPAAVPMTDESQRFAEPGPPARTRDPQRAARLAAVFADVDRLFREAVERGDLPGLAAGIVVDGELAWSQGHGTQ